MAIPYRELNDGSRSTAEDFRAGKSATRVFRVDSRDPIAARLAVESDEGGINSPFPGIPGAIVDSIAVSDGPGGVTTDVTYVYSSNRRGAPPPRDNKDRQGYYSFRSSIAATEVEYPYARRIPRAVPVLSGQPPTMELTWVIERDRRVPHVMTTLSINVLVNGWNVNKQATIEQQTNKLHNIGPELYLFRGAEIVQRTDAAAAVAQYDVTYTWLHDPVMPEVPVSSYDFTRFAFPSYPRQNFQAYTLVPHPTRPANDPAARPIFGVVETKEPDLNGWQALPGMPNL